MQARGVERREKLISAATELLNSGAAIEELSFRDIADKAGIPEGSAYHFYANKFDLFIAVAQDLSERFIKSHQQPIAAKSIKAWEDLAALLIERGADIYTRNPAAQKLLIGGRTPPEIKLQDRINDRAIGELMNARFEEFFELPQSFDGAEVFFHFIEITDLMFSLSVIEHGKITPNMLEEARRAGIGYLRMYLPPVLPRATPKQA